MADARPGFNSTTPPQVARASRVRARGGGQRHERQPDTNQQASLRGSRGGRYRSRGTRGNGRVDSTTNSRTVVHIDLNTHPPGPLDRGGISGDSPSGDADVHEGEDKTKLPVEIAGDEGEAEVCFICASPVVHNAIAPCNHRTCHICSLRLRALYKTRACAHCRTQSDFVIFTDDANKNYEDFSDEDFSNVDRNLGIKYEKPEIFEDTLLLLRYNCPDPSCDVACLGWPDLHRHVKSVHNKIMCDLCTRNKKVFTHEHELFTHAELRKHEKFGDDHPGAVDQSGFKGHPECGFCRLRFYGDDELYNHCREMHERCHICDRRNQGKQPVYYRNYDDLEVHYRKDHFLCPDKECLEKKFVVFESEIDLKAHQVEAHPHGLTKDALRDARRVDLSDFQLREQYQHGRGGRRDGHGRGRGRDPNSEPLPQSSAQPLRRDELAYQRQMAIQSAQAVSTRTFGGQLSTQTEAFAAGPSGNIQEPPVQVVANTSFPSLSPMQSALPPSTSQPASPQPEGGTTPQDQARRLRHNVVIERALGMLKNDQSKLAEFRTRISSFKNSSISATDLIESFFSLFDCTASELGKLIKEVAEIFEISSKRNDLLKAWNDWKAINEDYPSLPGASSTAGSTSHGGKRVLKLKSSTAQSSRSAVSRTGSWGTAAAVTNLFPPLPPVQRTGAGTRSNATPWASSSSTSSQSNFLPASRSTGQRGSAVVTDTEAFPALPVAPKPTSTVFSPGYVGSGVRRVIGGQVPGPNPWGGTGAMSTSNSAVPGASADVISSASEGQKKKGNKNKKQTLMHFG